MRVVFQGKTELMREIALRFQKEGIRTATGPLPGEGWGTRAWLAVASHQVEEAMAVEQQHQDRVMAREGLRVRDQVADLDAEETTCPACLTPFKTQGVTRCPECGLNFG